MMSDRALAAQVQELLCSLVQSDPSAYEHENLIAKDSCPVFLPGLTRRLTAYASG